MNLINKSNRSIGVPGEFASIVLGVGESKPITDGDLAAINKNLKALSLLDKGLLVIERPSKKSKKADDEELPPNIEA